MIRSTLPAFVIKICGITNEEDARVAVAAGANALGFNFYQQSPRYITPQRAQQIISAVPGEYLRVGVFVNSSRVEIAEAMACAEIDVLQLHGDCARLAAPLRIWKAIRPDSSMEEVGVEAFLMDAPGDQFGGSGKTFDWRLAAGHSYRTIIAGGLEAGNVDEAIKSAMPWGVDACSRLELSLGKKDATRVREFVSQAIAASKLLTQEIVL